MNSDNLDPEHNLSICPQCSIISNENIALKIRIAELEKQAHIDPLTGLANRRHFIENLNLRIQRCQRYGDVTALLFLDVDDLKSINDRHGHAAGDILLVQFAAIINSHIRKSDLAARIGGDEFAILLDNLDADQVESKIAFLTNRLGSAHLEHLGHKLPLGAAIGYCFVGPKDNVEGLMSRADAAMYRDKTSK